MTHVMTRPVRFLALSRSVLVSIRAFSSHNAESAEDAEPTDVH